MALIILGLVAQLVFGDSSDAAFAMLLIVVVPLAFIALAFRALIRVGDKRPPPVVIAQPQTVGPPPGWYPDKDGAMRWFDGSRWTEFTQPPPNPES
ncbi:DUF2510 domain-containing protein [Nocardia asiatica]